MKTYTTEEYLKSASYAKLLLKQGSDGQVWEHRKHRKIDTCSCVRELLHPKHRPIYWDECENCFGYGRPPIPWSELNK